jgi:hypothetical protein
LFLSHNKFITSPVSTSFAIKIIPRNNFSVQSTTLLTQISKILENKILINFSLEKFRKLVLFPGSIYKRMDRFAKTVHGTSKHISKSK